MKEKKNLAFIFINKIFKRSQIEENTPIKELNYINILYLETNLLLDLGGSTIYTILKFGTKIIPILPLRNEI